MPKIKQVSFVNHPLFGDATFDFTIEQHQPADSIVLAGENGSGKTRLLEELYQGIKADYHADALVRTQHQTVITVDLSDSRFYNFENPRLAITTAKLITSHDDSQNVYRKVEFYRDTATRSTLIHHVGEKNRINEIRQFSLNSAYSATDINYIPRQKIRGVTNLTLDSGELHKPDDVAREITQLLIDIVSQDNDDIALYARQHPGRSIPKSLLDSLRMTRFTRVFSYMFGDELKYHTVRDNIIPTFTKNGHEFDLSALSTGEKQIVFRGAYFLRNIRDLAGCPVFIDEPELSMHPKWAQKIYGYYRHIFQNDRGQQTSQIFTATHNEYVVDTNLQDDHALILDICIDCQSSHKFSRSLTGKILPTITLAEIKYLVFGIPTPDFHTQLFAYIQNTYASGHAVRTVDDLFLHHKAPRKKSNYRQGRRTITYHSLPAYIRNAIDHPTQDSHYTIAELTISIDFMIGLIKKLRADGVAPVR